MRKIILLINLILLTLLIQLASAQIILSQPKSLYNLGDDFEVDVQISGLQEGYMDVDLVCNGNTENIYHGIVDENGIIINRKLIPLYIGNLSGNCYINSNYGSFKQVSQNFKISKGISISPDILELNIFAGESVIIKGGAIKDNNKLVGQDIKGFVEVSLEGESKVVGKVIDGQFSVNFSTQENIKAGTYSILIKIYEEDNQGNKLSMGEARADLIVNQELKNIEIAIDKQIVNPGENISIIAYLSDKSGDRMEGDVSLVIEDSLGEVVYQKLVSSDKETSFSLPLDHDPGYSKIIIKKSNIVKEKVFEVTELEKIKIEGRNDSLLITNIGNVDYDKIIDIQIGDETILKQIELKRGESKSYWISAPDGKYNVDVRDEKGRVFQDWIALTGHSVDVKEDRTKLDILTLVWIWVIVIMGMVSFLLYKRGVKTKSYSFPVNGKKTPKQEKVVSLDNEGVKNSVKQAEHILVLNGQKQQASIIAIKIKEKLTKQAHQELIKTIQFKEDKSVLCQLNNYYLIIFSPLLTKTFKNEESAIKLALKIEDRLREHNRKFKDKIEFGIGVNSGEIINKLENNVLKFSSIGTTISMAKKAADASEGEVLLSRSIHEKTMTHVKAEKSGKKLGEEDLFMIKKLVHSDNNKKFIEDFLKRN